MLGKAGLKFHVFFDGVLQLNFNSYIWGIIYSLKQQLSNLKSQMYEEEFTL